MRISNCRFHHTTPLLHFDKSNINNSHDYIDIYLKFKIITCRKVCDEFNKIVAEFYSRLCANVFSTSDYIMKIL